MRGGIKRPSGAMQPTRYPADAPTSLIKREFAVYEDASSLAENSVCLGKIEHPVRLQPRAELHNGASLGAFGFLNVGTIVYGGVRIGRYLSCGRGAEIGVVAHPLDYLSSHGFTLNTAWFPAVPGYGVRGADSPPPAANQPTLIGHDVWIGAQAVIVAGVSIGTGAVVAANATVTRDVEPYEIVGGVPAKRIRFRFPKSICDRLLASQWWELPFEAIARLPAHDIEASLDQIAEIRRQMTSETIAASQGENAWRDRT
jgi:virginiamycin A acetyltransferase